MKCLAVLLFSLIVGACASTPVVPAPNRLFNDQLFLAPSERISADDVFAVSDAMKSFVQTELSVQLRAKGYQQGFVEALYKKGQLKLEYDTATTRNAAQAFEARAGNCLSLVIMSAALAKEIGLPVRYRSVYIDDTWSRSGDVYFSIGHVNLDLGKRAIDGGFRRFDRDIVTIDFLPPQEIGGVRSRVIGEETIVAMYMNNRAAESFTQGQLNDAYWWARAAIEKDPKYFSSYNTLGVIYQRHGNLKDAEQVLSYVLEREPENTDVMSNLVGVLGDLGRVAERTVLTLKLEQLQPHPPFSYFNLGRKAIRDGNFKAARDLFAKEIDRAPYYHEFHFWLAVAYVGLGDMGPARDELALAIEYSTNRNDREIYAAKLGRIGSTQVP
jgi:tetratricopeptide (TPR) repeat protein